MESSINSILKNYDPNDKGNLISILQAVQKEDGYINTQAVSEISRFLNIPRSQIFSVATFYRSFSLTPKGKCVLSVCVGTACHVRGAQIIVEELERELGIKAGESTPDLEFSLETVNCLGACALGPVIVVDGKYHGQMNIGKTQALLENIMGKTEDVES